MEHHSVEKRCLIFLPKTFFSHFLCKESSFFIFFLEQVRHSSLPTVYFVFDTRFLKTGSLSLLLTCFVNVVIDWAESFVGRKFCVEEFLAKKIEIPAFFMCQVLHSRTSPVYYPM